MSDLCRLTVVTPSARADLAIPMATSVGELVPTLLKHTSHDPLTHGQRWVLQRLGDKPLDEDGTPSSLDLRDGELLYLRPADAPMPAIDLDDVVAGVGSAIQQRPDRWRPAMTRRVMLGMSGLALLTVFAALLLPGAGLLRAITAGATALLLIIGSAVFARAVGDGTIAVLLGMFAVPFAALSGLLAPGTGGAVAAFDGANLLVAGAFAAATTGLVLLGGASLAPAFLSVAVLSVAVSISGALLLMDAGRWPAAALVAELAVVLGLAAPSLALRLVRLRLPHLPREAKELQDNITPADEDEVVAAAQRADKYLSALCGGVGLVSIACFAALAQSPGWEGRTLCAVLCGILLFRARALLGALQRVSLIGPAALGVAVMAYVFIYRADFTVRTLLVAALIVLAGLIVVGTRKLPGHQMLPYWGRAGDISEMLLGIASIPLVLATMNVYPFVRGLFG